MRLRRDTRWVARSSAAAAYCRSLTLVKNVEQLKQRKVLNDKWFALGGREIASPEELQELLWKRFFADASQWWDRRWTKPSPLHPDFTHRDFKFRLWLNNRHKPAWVDSQLASMDAGLKTTGLASVQWPRAVTATEAHLEFQVCRKLCVDGPVADAVDALDLLLQQGRHVPRDLFYRVLKRCIKVKDLTSGRRIHSLTVSNGYDGDAFLATHLIGLYASHEMLEEAMQVFTKVCTPSAHNWATIIFTYAKHGSAAAAAVAVKLYRKMCGSTTVTFDDRLYSAILKACAAAKDLVAGKEVMHSRRWVRKPLVFTGVCSKKALLLIL